MRVFICSLVAVCAANAASGRPPVTFEQRGAEYVAHGAGYSLAVSSIGAVLRVDGHAVRLSAKGASAGAHLAGLNRMPGKANYILSDFRASYDLYGGVRWRGVYPGIDLVFRGNQEHFEYDLEIAPGRDPGAVRLAFGGVDEMHIDRRGGLVLRAGQLSIHQLAPVAYQVIRGRKRPVDVTFRFDGSNCVRFRAGSYDRTRALVIDPEIVFARVFGGSGQSTAVGLARDAQGALYVAGTTNSTDLGVVNAAQSQLGTAPLLATSDAARNWTYPAVGTARMVNSIAAAPSAPLTIYAGTPIGVFKSTDAGKSWTPTASRGLTSPAIALAVDAGVPSTLYAATGDRLFVSTDGGESWTVPTNDLDGQGVRALAADPSRSGTVWVSVQNQSDLFRSTDFGQTWTHVAIQPGNASIVPVVIAIAQNGNMVVGTPTGLFLSNDRGTTWTAGATVGVYNTQGLAISPADAKNVYVTGPGIHRSTDGGQTFGPSVVAGVTQFGRVTVDPGNPSTVFATDSYQLYRSTDAGETWSQVPLPYPVSAQWLFVSPADSTVFVGTFTLTSVFVTKWSADGTQVLYSTYLGGSSGDAATSIAVDGNGSAYITGYTSSPDFPTTSGAYQTKSNGAQDIFITKLSADGSKLVYSTRLGSTSAFPAKIAVDSTGEAVVTGRAGAGFPVTPNAFQAAPVSGCSVQIPFEITPSSGDAFVTRLAADGRSLVYSTLLGGSCGTYGNSLALDAKGNAWVTGSTVSPDFPVTADALQAKHGGGYYDGFVARFNPAGGLGYATYLGGAGYDSIDAIAFDQSGNVFLAGESGGLTQPASAGAFQPQVSASCPVFSIGPAVYSPQGNGVVIKLDPAAHSIQRLTYIGAPYCLDPKLIAVDSNGQPWIAGGLIGTSAPPTVNPLFAAGNGFISKFNADFTALQFSTYFDAVAGLALDAAGFAYVSATGKYDAGTGAEPVHIDKIDATPAAISLDAIADPAPSAIPSNFRSIAAGEVLRLTGRNIGPATVTPGVVVAGAVATTVAGAQVTFDGVPAPLLSVSANEIDLIAPFSIAGKATTTAQVQYNGANSNAVQVAVADADLQILGVFNQDFSANSASNPARPGSVVILYVAGAGQTNPPAQNGQVNTAPFAAPGVPIQVQWFINNPTGTLARPVTYAGAAPGLVAGILQINFVAPEQQGQITLDLSAGNNLVPFTVYVGQ